MRRFHGNRRRPVVPRRMPRLAVCKAAAAAAIIAASLLLLVPASSAAPAARSTWAASDIRQSASTGQPTLAQLEARAARLSRQYRGQLLSLDYAERSARTATARELRLRRQVSVTRRRIVQLAVARYMGGAADPELAVLFSGDTAHLLGKSGIVEYLARQRTATMRQLQGLVAASERAGQAARARLADLQRDVSALAGLRQAVERLMAQFQPESPVTGATASPPGCGRSETRSTAGLARSPPSAATGPRAQASIRWAGPATSC